MMVEPARPAGGSPRNPAPLMSPPLDDDRGSIPKNAANITLIGWPVKQNGTTADGSAYIWSVDEF